MGEFYDLTPREAVATIDAGIWRIDQEQRHALWLAWHTAALTRTKRMPPLKQLLGGGEARKLEGAELERRQREHAEMTANLHIPNMRIAKRRDRE